MIVKNEAACLADCLRSAAPICDELVVADTGSEDATPAIARSFGARVSKLEWTDDFAAARNACMSQATGDWLLHMDADEVLDRDGAQRLRTVVDADGEAVDAAGVWVAGGAAPDARADAVELVLRNYCDEAYSWRWRAAPAGDPLARGFSGYLPVPLLRLFRSGRGFEYREPVHENITESVRERGGAVRREPICIHHYGLAVRRGEPSGKDELYLRIARRKAQERPDDAKAWYDLGEQLLVLKKYTEAEEAHQRALTLEPRFVDAAISLANLRIARQEFSSARAALAPMAGESGACASIQQTLGLTYLYECRGEEAVRCFHEALKAEPEHVMALMFLGRALDLEDRDEEALTAFRRAVQLAPNLAEAKRSLRAFEARQEGRKLFACGHTREAARAMIIAVRENPEDALAHNDLGVVLATAGAAREARRSFERALTLAPHLKDAADNLGELGPPK